MLYLYGTVVAIQDSILKKVKISLRNCKSNANAFCYILAQFINVRNIKFKLNKNKKLCEAYEAYLI